MPGPVHILMVAFLELPCCSDPGAISFPGPLTVSERLKASAGDCLPLTEKEAASGRLTLQVSV